LIGEELTMAFECGALSVSGGKAPVDLLRELLAHLQGSLEGLSFTDIRVMDAFGWVSTDVTVDLPGGVQLTQYIQVSSGSEILKTYLDSAREELGEDLVQGKDVMLTMIMSGPTDFRISELALGYAAEAWRGILWDESSGFAVSVVE
jgi:hypothetical protein